MRTDDDDNNMHAGLLATDIPADVDDAHQPSSSTLMHIDNAGIDNSRKASSSSSCFPRDPNSLCAHTSAIFTGPLALMLGMTVYAASSPFFKLIKKITDKDLVTDPLGNKFNAVSACNILFMGNFLQAITSSIVFRRDMTTAKLRAVTYQQWRGLVLVTVVQSTFARFGELYALEMTSEANVNALLLVGRLEPPVTFLLTLAVFDRKKSQPRFAYISVVIYLPLHHLFSAVVRTSHHTDATIVELVRWAFSEFQSLSTPFPAVNHPVEAQRRLVLFL